MICIHIRYIYFRNVSAVQVLKGALVTKFLAI